jgi:hypothetical protein
VDGAWVEGQPAAFGELLEVGVVDVHHARMGPGSTGQARLPVVNATGPRSYLRHPAKTRQGRLGGTIGRARATTFRSKEEFPIAERTRGSPRTVSPAALRGRLNIVDADDAAPDSPTTPS